MTGVPVHGETFEVECPHCHKGFQAQLLAGRAERHHGFKCPHCRLFVPYRRAEEKDLLEPASPKAAD
jgi:NAD-dependent SIR2 family protein deacetylase